MKKLFLCVLLAMSQPFLLQAQRLETSESFEEPELGWNKVLQLKNGNTFFFHFTKKNGVVVRVYDKKRMLSHQQVITGNLWDHRRFNETKIEGVYEIGGQPVLFLHQLQDRVPSLYRIKLDPVTGAVAGEKLISTLPAYKTGSAWAMAYGGVSAMDFHIEKDPVSDYYAVVNFNSFSQESDARIEVIYYDGAAGTHKIRNRSFYEIPDGGFKYLDFIAMSVDTNAVYLCAYGYNPKKWSAKESKVIVSRLGKTDHGFTHKKMEHMSDFRGTKAEMLYNPGTNLLQLMTLNIEGQKGGTTYYQTLISYIDPESLTVISSKPIAARKVSEDLYRQIGKSFTGLPQQMVLNADNTTTVLMEEMQQMITRNASTGAILSAKTLLGSVGVCELTDRGMEEDGHVVLKAQMCMGLINSMYLASKKKGVWSYRPGGMAVNNNAFLSFDYVHTGKNKYILFNDYPDNFEKAEGVKKRRPVTYISEANTVCYRMKNGIPEKFYLFGAPDSKKASRFCYVEASHYLPEQHSYATLMVTRNGKKKEASIAWVNFE